MSFLWRKLRRSTDLLYHGVRNYVCDTWTDTKADFNFLLNDCKLSWKDACLLLTKEKIIDVVHFMTNWIPTRILCHGRLVISELALNAQRRRKMLLERGYIKNSLGHRMFSYPDNPSCSDWWDQTNGEWTLYTVPNDGYPDEPVDMELNYDYTDDSDFSER